MPDLPLLSTYDGDPSQLAMVLDSHVEALAAFEALVDVSLPDVSLVDRARLLVACDRLNMILNGLGSVLNDALAANMEADQVEVPGVGWLDRQERKGKAWRDEDSRDRMLSDLSAAIVRLVAAHPMTGEIDPGARNVAQNAVGLVLDSLSIGDTKAAFRRRLGLNPEDYKRETVNGYKVSVVTPLSEDRGR